MSSLAIAPKDLVANITSSKLDMNGKQKALIKNLTAISRKVSKQLSTINKAKDKLALTVKSSIAEQRDGLDNTTIKDRFSLISGLFSRRQRQEERKEKEREAALEREREQAQVQEVEEAKDNDELDNEQE